MKIVFATNNPHKLEEVNAIAHGSGFEFVMPEGDFNPEETGDTFEENALIKARAAAKLMNRPAIADDSGLCVDALGGAPGLYSARYAGTQSEKIEKLLNELEGKDDRCAKFVCAMVLVDENGNKVFSTLGECFGSLAETPKGENGFGYDPIFVIDGYQQTMAELSEDEKNKISHRSNALQEILKFSKKYFQGF